MNKLKLFRLSSLLTLSTFSLLSVQCKPEGTEDTKPAPPAAAVPDKPSVPLEKAAVVIKDDIGENPVKVPIEGLPAFGSPNALVTIVAFTDYQCPYCAKADERIAQLRAEYGDRVRLVLAMRPLPFHEQAEPAARAMLAAVEQGKGEAMHKSLFARQTKLQGEAVKTAATEAGLDLEEFDRARKDPSVELALRRSEAVASKLFVSGTPTFFVNGRRLIGARPIEAFRALIDEELGKAQRIVDGGVRRDQVYATIMATAGEATPPKSETVAGLEHGADQVVDVGIEDAPILGAPGAPVTIVFFSDFECPFCVRAEKTLKELEAQNPGKVRVAFRHKPLPMHPHARLAAKASMAAERQGKFWEYHDVLLQHRDALEREQLEQYATDVGMDRRRFGRDLDDPALEARLTADEKRAEDLGVKGTPTAFVNGRRITGAQPLGTWLSMVDKATAGKAVVKPALVRPQ